MCVCVCVCVCVCGVCVFVYACVCVLGEVSAGLSRKATPRDGLDPQGDFRLEGKVYFVLAMRGRWSVSATVTSGFRVPPIEL